MLGEERSPCGLDLGLRSGITFGHICLLSPSAHNIVIPAGVGLEGRGEWDGAGGECMEWISLHYALISILILQSCHLSKRGKAGEEEERE